MYIKEIILDGFKSYGSRVDIKGFDPEFNAITGLNGTGKSNILDSICFVLGITNLAQVRANSLTELVYKSGQAGVTMATVTIIFDNSDPARSPLNYEQFKEIVITRQVSSTGKTRYLINGSTVTNRFVADFFNSVQLNVNNPHFLIMQGRITKVLSMKPPEILSMIEEAAGTRMYENKKQGAQKTIEKKDCKLKEMDEMVVEQINPRLQQLKDERTQYFEFQKTQRELEQLTRIYVAWEYVKTEEACDQKETQIEIVGDELITYKSNVVESHLKIKEVDRQILEMQRIRDDETGGKLKEAERQLKEREKVEAKVLGQMKFGKENMNAEKKKKKQIETSMKEDEKALGNKKEAMGTAQSVFDQLREAEKQDAEALTNAQKKFQAVSAGLLANDEGSDATLQDQLIVAKQQLAEFETEVQQCTMQLEHSKTELRTKEPQLKKTEMTFAKDKRDLDSKQKEVSSLKEQLKKFNYQDGSLERLQDSLRVANGEMRQCSERVNNCANRFPNLSFHYKDPRPNFDRRKVRGMVCKLITVKDQKFARAIETAAGGKLYNVVVDTDETSSELISRGQLARRTTFAPMNKIRGAPLNPQLVQRAKNLVGENNVFSAQSLINYEPQYENIMQWVFGGVFICTDSNAAMKISYKSDIQKKSITLDGDVFDPSGTLSGGAPLRKDAVLVIIGEMIDAEKALSAVRAEVARINSQIEEISQIATNFETCKQRLEVMQQELDMVKMRLEQTAHYQLQKEIEDIRASIATKTSRIEECKKEVQEKSRRVRELENNMKNIKSIRERELKNAEADLKRIKKKAEDSRENWKKREQEFETLNLEIQELEKCVQNGKDQITKTEEAIKGFEEEIKSQEDALKNAQEQVKEWKENVKAVKDEIGKQDKEMDCMAMEKDKLNKLINDIELNTLSAQHNLTKLKNDLKEGKHMMCELNKKYKWIKDHREYFGQPNGMYDFEANDPKMAGVRIKQLDELKEKLGRSVNAKAMDILGTQEEQFNEVMNKKGIIEGDRSKILSVIEELDVKKEEVIRKAWEKVDQDFNSILSSLLPGASAQLKPVDGKDFIDGLEVKVGFGGIWKDSLDELSGGQRSLVALSLILAMLLFKPAPLYILDEVDAALDPSHTQNIGQMLKSHFRQSQFIIVSLKDGMFNNANVLFRTSFVDGMSSVIRTTTKQ